jgi:hypothetical protein
MRFAVALMLEPVDGGSKLTYRVDAESGLGGVFGKLADPLIVRAKAGPSAPTWNPWPSCWPNTPRGDDGAVGY